jgi:hypothetical protein
MYQSIDKAFPAPSGDENGRPYFNDDSQQSVSEENVFRCIFVGAAEPALVSRFLDLLNLAANAHEPE